MDRYKRNRARLIFIFLLIVCTALIALSILKGSGGGIASSLNLILKPMQNGINTFGSLVSNVSEHRKDMAALESENEELKAEVEELQSTITSLQQNMSDYDELLKLTELTQKYPGYTMTGARIIGKNPGNWYDTFTINKGSRDGIKQDMNVVAEDGLVGIVTRVDLTSSLVKSIIDDTSSVSAMISKNYDNCLVEGDLTLSRKGLLSVDMISDDTSIVDGDEVVTSYISDKYLPGILIGYISELQSDDAKLSYHAKLTPVVDFQHLSTVMVIKQLKSELYENQFEEIGETVEETVED